MASAISQYIAQIQNAVYGEQVRGAIVNALQACYSDVENPDLQSDAFYAAILQAYDQGVLDIVEVTKVADMTNENIIYRYMGTEVGYTADTLYFYNGSAWIPIGSGVRTVATASLMTDTNAIYKYTGTEAGYIQNALYYHDGAAWRMVSFGFKTATTAFWGKRIGIIGDSISTFNLDGYKKDGYAMFYPQYDVQNVDDTWWKYVVDASCGELDGNLSYSASKVTKSNVPDFYERCGLLDSPDVIFVALGSNDAGVALGSYDYSTAYESLSETQFRPAYIKGIKALKANYPSATIVCIALQMGSDYLESIQSIANQLSCTFIDCSKYASQQNVHPAKLGMMQIASAVLAPYGNDLLQSKPSADAAKTGSEIKKLNDFTKQFDDGITEEMIVDGAVTKSKLGNDVVLSIPRVHSSSEMTDYSQMYFYVGAEQGFTRFAIYYYDGQKWTTLNSESESGSATLPELRIYGDISVMTAQKNEPKIYSYIWKNPDDDDMRAGYCSMKWQGESSLTYPKKNYTIKFYHDGAYSRKDKISFFDKLVLKKSKWVVKANWVDRSMAKNIVSCRIWGDLVKSRKTAPVAQLKDAPNYGAINGFPIQIYVNDVWHGLYTLNIPKDEDTFNMDLENPHHCAVCGDSQSGTGSTAFRQATTNGWELEVPEDAWPSWTETEEVEGVETEVTHRVSDNFVSMISFVMNATDAEFKEHLNEYIDVESAVDYYLMAYYDCGVDSLGRNLLMVTYDGGYKWYCSLYDADTTWGNDMGGQGIYNPQKPCPEEYGMATSLLWERLEECFGDELYERWTELRKTIFNVDYVQSQFNMFWRDIPDELYDRDVVRWTGVDPQRPNFPQWNIDFKSKIMDFIADRAVYCDAQIKAMRTPVACTGIELDQSSISFSNGTPITLTATVEPENTTYDVVWSVADNTVAKVIDGKVYPLKNGSTTVTATCGSQSASCTVSISNLSFSIAVVGANASVSPSSAITPNAEYTGTLTAVSGYQFTSVVITMGGEDITSTCYTPSTGAVHVSAVTGDISIAVTTQFHYDTTGLEYALPAPFIMDGVSYIDTGFQYDGESDLTIALDLIQPTPFPSDYGEYALGASTYDDSHRFCYDFTSRGLRGIADAQMGTGLDAVAGDHVKAVFRFNSATNVLSGRAWSQYRKTNWPATTGETTTNNNHATVSPRASRDAFTQTVYIGAVHTSTGAVFGNAKGTINDCRIFTRRWSDAEVKNYLGVDELSTIFTDDMDNYVPST